jgi:hypothetical protein
VRKELPEHLPYGACISRFAHGGKLEVVRFRGRLGTRSGGLRKSTSHRSASQDQTGKSSGHQPGGLAALAARLGGFGSGYPGAERFIPEGTM